ncbi:MAG: 5-formyltetrahydrofolate cyclo-ligase [Elusimicrobia bacterium]|nr:5-formyltetrahydrofolate cyclo-ligase [Elusimicrobiota bacterium]
MKKSAPDPMARNKHFLRLHFREEVRSLSLAERRLAGRAVARRVAALPEFRRAKKVGLFLSLPYEIDTAPLIALAHAAGKTVAVPVVFPGRGGMRFAVLADGRPSLKQKVSFNRSEVNRGGKKIPSPYPSPASGRGKPLQFAQELQQNVYGILEPVSPQWVEGLDLLVVPGAAFTSRGDRLGAGAGYYDRFLVRRPSLRTIGVCFDEQMAVRLPRAAHDRKVDQVVSPSRLFRVRGV